MSAGGSVNTGVVDGVSTVFCSGVVLPCDLRVGCGDASQVATHVHSGINEGPITRMKTRSLALIGVGGEWSQ